MAENNDPDDKGPELPRALEVMWGRSPHRTRRPAQALSLERIVAAAIEIADREGLQSLSMARLAERLGCAPMSLYRHVAGKGELQAFMLDAAPGPPPPFHTAPPDWRAALTRWSEELLAVYHRHPWILQVAQGPPLDPGQLAWLEAGLRTLGGTPLTPADKLTAVLTVLHYVRGVAQLSTTIAPPGATEGEGPRQPYGELLAHLLDAARFPALVEVVEAGVFGEAPDGSPDTTFGAGLDRILDGVEVQIAGRAAAP
jgi:AcrR family transcriptional regulator